MLQKLNERIQGLIAWIIIVLVTITFLLFGIDYYLQSHHDSTTQVSVNDQPITKQAFDSSFRRARQSNTTSLDEKHLKQQILHEMIVNSVSLQAARAGGFEVSNAQADAAILNIPQFQDEGRFSSDRYTQALNNLFFTPESFQKEVRQGMLLNQQRFALIGTSFALPQDIENFIKLSMQTRDYEYLLVPSAQFLNEKAVSEQDLSIFYNKNKQLFLAPEQVSIDYIILSLQDIKHTITLTDAQIKQYYDENKSVITKPLSEVKSDITDQLLAELSQAKYAAILDKLSDLSYQTPDTLNPVAKALNMKIATSKLFSREGSEDGILKNKQLIEAAFSHDVMDLGNNSEPVQLDNDSVVIFRVNKHVLSTVRPLNDVRSLISDILVKKQASADATRIGKELLAVASTNVPKLEKLIQEYHIVRQSVKAATRDGDVAPLAINEMAFNLSHVREVDGRSIANGDFVLVILKSINDGNLQSVDKEQITSITQQIESNYGVMDYDLYVSELMLKAHVSTH